TSKRYEQIGRVATEALDDGGVELAARPPPRHGYCCFCAAHLVEGGSVLGEVDHTHRKGQRFALELLRCSLPIPALVDLPQPTLDACAESQRLGDSYGDFAVRGVVGGRAR